MFEVQVERSAGWRGVATPKTRADAVDVAAALRSCERAAVRILLDGEPLDAWTARAAQAARSTPLAAGPTPTLR